MSNLSLYVRKYNQVFNMTPIWVPHTTYFTTFTFFSVKRTNARLDQKNSIKYRNRDFLDVQFFQYSQTDLREREKVKFGAPIRVERKI